jgi:transcriptional regulator with XRE-family HTH domain
MNGKLVGQLVRERRRQQGLTGVMLGRKAGMSQSKISKIEIGYYSKLQVKDVERILNILEMPNDIRQTIYREIERAQPKALLDRPYGTAVAANYYELDSKAALIRIFTIQGTPVLLQTTARRLSVLRRHGVAEEDLGTHMKDAMKRQDLLWDQRRFFHFILHETMLHTVPAGLQNHMREQFDRIERLIDLPNVKIGIIPLRAGLPLAEVGPFALYDRARLFMASAGGDIVSEDEASINLYSRVFEELDGLALYGEPAKELLQSAPKY